MTDMNFSFNDLGDVPTHTGQRVIPDSGDYNVMISNIKMESNKNNDGHNIEVTYSILDGEHAGSEVMEWLAVINKNETAQRIAQSKLKAIYLVTKKTNAASFTELQGSLLRVRLLKKENTYRDSNGNERQGFNNEVSMYMDTSGRNPEGKEVAEYSGPAVVASKAKSSQSKASSDPFATSGNKSSNKSQEKDFGVDDDDDIPF